jgi:hypothetical protein
MWKSDDAANKKTLAIFKRQFQRWGYMVKSYGWEYVVKYYTASEDMPDGSDPNTRAITKWSFKYLYATISVNLNTCSGMDEDEIEEIVIHELTHLLVSPLVESSETTPLEYTVTSIARILQGLRQSTPKIVLPPPDKSLIFKE